MRESNMKCALYFAVLALAALASPATSQTATPPVVKTGDRWQFVEYYGIASAIQRASDDVLGVVEGALYPALHRLEVRGWLRSKWGASDNNRRAKFYRLSALGRRALDEEAAYWDRVASAVTRVMQRA